MSIDEQLIKDKKELQLQRARDWKARNKERVKASRKAYYEANKERSKIQHEIWKENNLEYYKQIKRASDKKYRDANYRKLRAKQIKNKEHTNAIRRERYRNDYKYRSECILRASFKQSLKLQNTVKNASVMKYLGCEICEFIKYIESKWLPGMSWSNHGQVINGQPEVWQIDHILPCSSFDLSKEEDRHKCFHYTNMQPLWGRDNQSKGSKIL